MSCASPGGSSNGLFGVSCASAAACMAVGASGLAIGGASGLSGSEQRTLIESWDGARWSVLPSPSPGTFANRLNGVSCVAADACTAVGVTGPGNGVTASLIESWDGSHWTVVPTPNPGPSLTWFSGVSCASTDACIATGNYFTTAGADRTLIESLKGTHWSAVPHPQPGIESRELISVSCTSTTTCTAAGNYFGGGTNRTLIETGTARR